MRTVSKLSLAVLALAVSGATAARAQSNTATIQANAQVQTPITVAAGQALNFGNVFPGVNKPIGPDDLTSAGRFDVTGQGGAAVTLSFTLPATLSAGGPLTMPIDNFNAIRAEDNAQLVNGAFFSPGASNAATLGALGTLFVWVGARVTPAVSQAAGLYTGDITLTVVY
jgi:uncharacterized protein DUF4402